MPDQHDRDNASVANFLSAIDAADDELASLRGSYMQQCKGPRATIKEIKGEAREAGVNIKAFNALLKDHREDRAKQKRFAALEQEDAHAYQEMVEALGEFGSTPLGSAAIDRAKPRIRRGRRDESLYNLSA